MIPIRKEVTLIGRKQADIILDDPKASASHVEIRREGANYIIKDLGSSNGTFLNRRRIEQSELSDQDVIEIGVTTLCFFDDTRDFHGEVEEVTGSVKASPPSQITNVTELTTTTKAISQMPVQFEIIEGNQVGKKMRFEKSHIIIGRSESDLVLNDLDVSRSHCMVEVLSSEVIFLKDLKSTNGTFLNSERIESSRLKSGDRIGVGNTILKFEYKPVSEGKSS